MIYLAGLVATACLGLGWVLQQRVAATATESELSLQLLLHLMKRPTWWLGIAAMAAGASLGGWALRLGTVTLVEALLSANLLFAFIFAALLGRAAVRWPELAGAALLCTALGVFITVGDPRPARHLTLPPPAAEALSIGVVAGVVAVLLAFAKRRAPHVEAALIAAGAGIMYGLQDAATRTSLTAIGTEGLGGVLATPWPYVIIAAAAVGIALSQSAFRTARLDYSLPPTSAAEPITGTALGIGILGDRLSVSAGGLAVESVCVIAMIAGVILVGKSGSLVHGFAHLHPHRAGRDGATRPPPD